MPRTLLKIPPATMKAALLTAYTEPLEIVEMPIPEPDRGEVLVKLEACGVCHTDLHFWRGEHKLPGPLPRVMGHEGVGRVVKVGSHDSKFEIGDRVGVGYVFDTCGTCPECLTGHETNCRAVTCTGVNVNGCFAEYVVLRENWTTRIPEPIATIEAAPLLCAGVAAYSAVLKANLKPGELVLVFGVGGLGAYAIQYAKLSGARVAVVDIDDAKLKLAADLGSDYTFRTDDNFVETVQSLGGANACFNFAPVASTWQKMLASSAPRGRVVLVALSPDTLSFEAPQIIEAGLTVMGSADGTRQELRQLMNLAHYKRVRSIVEAMPFQEINAALQRLDAGELRSRLVLDFGK